MRPSAAFEPFPATHRGIQGTFELPYLDQTADVERGAQHHQQKKQQDGENRQEFGSLEIGRFAGSDALRTEAETVTATGEIDQGHHRDQRHDDNRRNHYPDHNSNCRHDGSQGTQGSPVAHGIGPVIPCGNDGLHRCEITMKGHSDNTAMASEYHRESFTESELGALDRFFTNTTGPVFGLTNLPEVVKGALFARYSRSPKSLRRLFIDEFYNSPDVGIEAIAGQMDDEDSGVRLERAEELFQRVFTEFGDDSVAQLGGVHLACEQASNVLTKVLEWGRIAAYLEQSTRYMFYDRRLGDRFRYHTPAEVAAAGRGGSYRAELDALFEAYGALTEQLTRYYETLYPQQSGDTNFIYRSTIRSKVCDDLRGLLPAATISNVGIYATGQSYEMLLLRMRASRLIEVREYSDLMLVELRKLIPAFLRRVDIPDRGGEWSEYLAQTSAAVEELASSLDIPSEPRPDVTLVEFDPEAELKIAAAALYSVTDVPDDVLLAYVRGLPASKLQHLFGTYIGKRSNRRHRPGRALERSGYRFDILCDYGIFRDLQRHRMMTLEWQTLGTNHGYVTPDGINDVGAVDVWEAAMERAAAHHGSLTDLVGPRIAQYAVPLAFRVRFFMQLNAREAFHLLELRTAEGGHAGYRRVCQEMHRLIGEEAGHHLIADAMQYVDHTTYGLGRLESERRAAARRAAAGVADPTD